MEILHFKGENIQLIVDSSDLYLTTYNAQSVNSVQTEGITFKIKNIPIRFDFCTVKILNRSYSSISLTFHNSTVRFEGVVTLNNVSLMLDHSDCYVHLPIDKLTLTCIHSFISIISCVSNKLMYTLDTDSVLHSKVTENTSILPLNNFGKVSTISV